MTSRSGPRSSSRRSGLALAWSVCGLLALAGVSACGDKNRAELFPEAVAGCEEPAAEQTMTDEFMLPGRVCGACHKTGGQASNSPWTLSGTIYSDPKSACNSGGLEGVNIEVLYANSDPNGQYRANMLQPGGQLVTNRVGNFRTATRFVPPLKIRIYKGDSANPTMQKFMMLTLGAGMTAGSQVKVDCATCHQLQGGSGVNGTEGRIYLN